MQDSSQKVNRNLMDLHNSPEDALQNSRAFGYNEKNIPQDGGLHRQ